MEVCVEEGERSRINYEANSPKSEVGPNDQEHDAV